MKKGGQDELLSCKRRQTQLNTSFCGWQSFHTGQLQALIMEPHPRSTFRSIYEFAPFRVVEGIPEKPRTEGVKRYSHSPIMAR